MIFRTLRTWALLLLLTSGVAVLAQDGPGVPSLSESGRALQFEHLSVADGLSHSAVTAILQDRRGFMWFGTQSGLNRYDGYEIRVFKYDPDDSTGLSHNWIVGLLEDSSGAIWVGTFGGGLNRFDPETQTFTAFRHNPDDPTSLSHDLVGPLFQDSENVLWVGTEGGGLNRFDPETETFKRYTHDPRDATSLSDTTDAVRVIFEDRQGRLWIGTWGGGLCLFDRDLETFTRYPLDTRSAPQTVLAIHEDRDGRLWIGTEHAGLNRVDPLAGTVTRVEMAGGEPLDGIPIGGLYEDRRGIFWMGTWGKGICQFDPRARTATCHQHDPFDPRSLSDNGVGGIYEDRSGVLWMSTWNGLNRLDVRTAGVARFRFDPRNPGGLSDSDVQSLYVDRAGTVWTGTWKGGLNRLDRETRQFRHYRYGPGGLSNDNVQAILEDREGAIWIGTWGGGLNRLDPVTESIQHFSHGAGDPGSLYSDSILEIYEDGDGVLWFGTWNGLARRDPDTGLFERIPEEPRVDGGPGHIEVWAINEDRDGVLWVGTRDDGLGRLDRARGTLTFLRHDPDDPKSIGHNTVWDIHEDRSGGLWVATGGGGLNRYDRAEGRFMRYTSRQSMLLDNVIYSIVEDNKGHLWLNTEKGLTRFEPETERFTNYDDRPELHSCGYNGAAFHDKGTIYVDCADGFAAFRPEDIGTNAYPPSVVITDLKLFGRSVEPSEEGALKQPVSEAGEVMFKYRENDLSFSFVALHFANPAHNQYAYRLENYDPDWRQAGTQRTATYTNLDPGEYVFRVRAANSDGVWNEEGTSLRVVIRPPWWQTTPAYLLYAMLTIAALMAVNRAQRERIIRTERSAALIREKELRADAAEAQARALHLENQRQTEELERARRVQLSMLPEAVPRHPRTELAAAMQTATEVGGDYYDFSVTPDGRLNLIIGDATGHGVQAGTMVTAMKSLWNAFSADPDLEKLLTRSSDALRRMNLPNMYMALAVGRWDGRTLELVGAGMPPALVYRHTTGAVELVPLKGMPLAGPMKYPYRRRHVTLAPDDVVVLMSDGFPELFDGDGEMLGYDRAVEVISEAVRDRSPEDIIAALMEETAAWRGGGPPNDDVTFIVLKATSMTTTRIQSGDGAGVVTAAK